MQELYQSCWFPCGVSWSLLAPGLVATKTGWNTVHLLFAHTVQVLFSCNLILFVPLPFLHTVPAVL